MTSHEWGRVDADGTVYVRTVDGERAVGQYAAGTAEEALAFYVHRFEGLEGEVALLEQRVNAGAVSPESAADQVTKLREQVVQADAVGDLTSLAARLDALRPIISSQREARKAERAAKVAEAKVEKERIVAEAEQLAEGNDWRHGANRLRDLLESWKALPRLDRTTDDALWRRFSSARTAYTRRRRAHFAEQSEKREGARVIKERLVAEAEALAGSTEWGDTSRAYRDLMHQWKAAGPAPRDVDDALWQRFRAAQDTFFSARDADNARQDAEFAANAEVKEALLVEAEAIDPTADLEAAKKAFRDVADRWEAAGKVPRDRIRELEGRLRKVEQAIRSAEEDQWRRSDPEKTSRANDMVGMFEAAVDKLEADLEKARAAGDDKTASRLEENLSSQRALLDMARKASAEFSG